MVTRLPLHKAVMVTQVVVQNTTQYTLAVLSRTRSLDLSCPELPAKTVANPVSQVKPNERATVTVILRNKVPAHEKHEILTDLTILDAKGSPTDVSVILKQKIHGKLIGSSLQISLSAQPYELLAPDQPWSKSHKVLEGRLSLQAGALNITYRFLPSTAGDGDIEYVIKQVEAMGLTSDETKDIDVGMALPSDLVLEEVYENQRGSGLSGPKSFSSKALFPGTERGQWSNTHGQHRVAKEYIDLPNSSWKWLWDWKVDMSGDVDEEGWQEEVEANATQSSRRRAVALEEATTAEELVQRVQDYHVMDTERTELIRAFLAVRRTISIEQLQLAFDSFQFEIGRVEAIRSLCPDLLTKEQVQQLLPMIKFFSYKRQLATELDLDLARAH